MPSSITEPTASISLPPKPLPPSRAPSLVLTHPTRVEQTRIANLNGVKWRGALSLPAYHRREDHLGAQLLTRNAGITHWILVDTAEKVPAGSERTVLASCESIRKRALVGYTVTGSSSRTVLRDVVSHGIGSVFCAEKLRGRGYAGRMMQELGKRLETWQLEKGVPGREECLFTVLYSDIGKKYYASHGWHPFPSSHLSLLPLPQLPDLSGLPPSTPLYTTSLRELCAIDEVLIRRKLATADQQHKVRVAFVPDFETMRWHHAREEFVANELWQRKPEIKGAMIGAEGDRIWCIWTRMWHDANGSEKSGNTMHILRLVIENEGMNRNPDRNGTDAPNENGHLTNGQSHDNHKVSREDMVVSLLVAAQQEAANWSLTHVQVWNPSPLTIHAGQRAQDIAAAAGHKSKIELVHREDESITCLRWSAEKATDPTLKDVSWMDVAWMENEKYGWC